MGSNSHYEGDPTAIKKNDDNTDITVYPRGLSVVWGNDNRYWKIPKPELKLDDRSALELLQVCWLEVTGSVEADPGKRYEVGFELSLTPDAFGWDGCSLYVMSKRGKNGSTWKRNPLDNIKDKNNCFVIKGKRLELVSSPEPSDKKIYFGLYEVWSGKWKGGLKIHHAYVKEVQESAGKTS